LNVSELHPPQTIIDYGTSPVRRRTSALAVISLLLGILACVPILSWIGAIFEVHQNWNFLILLALPFRIAPFSLVGALAALASGIAGIRATRSAKLRGRRRAIVGLILGIVTTFAWGSISGFPVY
jgi:hypothetical protein